MKYVLEYVCEVDSLRVERSDLFVCFGLAVLGFFPGGRKWRNSNLCCLFFSSHIHSLLQNVCDFLGFQPHIWPTAECSVLSQLWYGACRSLWKLLLDTTLGKGVWLKEEIDVEIFCGVCLWSFHLNKQENMNIYLKTGLLDTFIWSMQAFNKQSWNWNR